MHDLKEKPLTLQEFEVARLVAVTGKHGDDQLKPFETFTYEKYLWARWFARKMEPVCAVDHMHTIMEYANNCRVEINHKTKEQTVTDQDGDSYFSCEECLGLKKQYIIYDYNVGDFEHLQENQSAGERK